jgi:hypothetical protein
VKVVWGRLILGLALVDATLLCTGLVLACYLGILPEMDALWACAGLALVGSVQSAILVLYYGLLKPLPDDLSVCANEDRGHALWRLGSSQWFSSSLPKRRLNRGTRASDVQRSIVAGYYIAVAMAAFGAVLALVGSVALLVGVIVQVG